MLWVVTILGFAYLFVPLITIVVFTFNNPGSKFNTDVEVLHVGQLAPRVRSDATTPTPSSRASKVAFIVVRDRHDASAR